ncbi:MAG: nucleoside transporter C-terminal domain-containing protein [Planctomycetota bacterium]|nr:nucleoside transporter C-terminal domain-containing protein [Planctomycetota bacterium]
MLRLVSLLGFFVMIGLLYALSRERRAINWRLVGTGVLIQGVLGVVFLSWTKGRDALWGVGEGFKVFLGVAGKGTEFVFGGLAGANESLGFIFATQVLPTLIFFSSFMAVLYHLGVMQFIVRIMAGLMVRVMGTSGSESLSACGNIFVGQTEAPLMVKPYLGRMTLSELHAIMTGGFCTIAGGVFALYVGFGVEAGHLMVASVMAVPAGLVCTKMLWPETEESETMGTVAHTAKSEAKSPVEAAANGAIDGLKLALNVGAMLIAFLGIVAVINWGLSAVPMWGEQVLSLELILSWLFAPVAAVMGVPGDDIMNLSELLGKKIVLTELIAYQGMGEMVDAGAITPRTKMIASFALCGFANLGSVAIQIGGLGAMAPERRSDIARIAVRAMWAGAIATCMTACLAGLMG